MSPVAPKRPCSAPGCPQLVSDTEPCPTHGKRPWEHQRASPAARGYGYSWRQLRARILARNPICRACGRAPSTTCDHVVPRSKGGTDAESNLRGLCHRCHERKSAKEGQKASMESRP